MNPSWIEFAARGAVLLAVALTFCRLTRRAAPGLRHGLLAAAMLGLLALPALAHVLPRLHAPVLPVTSEAADRLNRPPGTPAPAGIDIPVSAASTPWPAGSTGPLEAAPLAIPVPHDPTVRAQPAIIGTAPPAPVLAPASVPWVTYVWILGALLALLPWVLGTVRVGRWARRAVPLERDDLRASDGALLHPAVSTPMTVGIWRPKLLLPVDALMWPREQLHAAIRHEQAHVERRDVLKNALARVAASLHWFDPLAWIAAARLRRESELACDEAVLRSGVSPTTLASTLVEVARTSRGLRLHGSACAMGASGLERRVDAILSSRPAASSHRRWPRIAAALAVCAAVTLVAVLQPAQRDAVADGDGPKASISVGPRGCDHTTIQAAVDAAPPQAQIRIEAGTYDEHVTITKPLVLMGAGYDETRLVSTYVPTREKGARSAPTLLVEGVRDVKLRGLRISLRRKGAPRQGVSSGGSVVDIRGAGVRMERCAVVGSPASGVAITGPSQVELEVCLIAAIRATGIAITADEAGSPRVRIRECDVRYGHHRGITIGRNCDSVAVRGCRIMGSGWHGIRYDDASPTILNNRITNNVRFGIYASGRTRATIQDNLFAGSGLDGIGCWFRSEDIIRRNTFVHNARSGLAILGEAAPRVENNLFVDNKTGVSWGQVASKDGSLVSTGGGTIARNWFWQNGADASNALPPEHGNRRADPKLRTDQTLAPDSPARAVSAGSTLLPPAVGPFPTQPEEAEAAKLFAEHMAKYGGWARRHAPPRPAPPAKPAPPASKKPPVPKKPGGSSAHELAKPWIDAIVRPGNKEGRAKAWDEVCEALGHDDPIRNHAGLTAILRTTQIRLDRKSLRPLVLPLLDKLEGRARTQAFYVLHQTGLEAGDLALLLKAVRQADAPLRESASHLIRMFTKGQVVGEAEAAVLRLLESNEPRELREVFRGLWGGHYGPALEKRLLELSSDPRLAHDVVYFALSTQENKSADVVRALARAAVERQGETWRVIWGLRNGLKDEAAGEAVADFYADRISEFARRDWVDKGLLALKKYGKARHAAVVRAFAEDEDLDPGLRERALDVLRTIERR